jgi:hypothetical protein
MSRYFWAPAPPEFDASRALACHTNSERPFVFSAIPSCNLANAFSPSPYSISIDTSKIPSRQYAISFTLVVLLFVAHDILLTTGTSARTVLSRRTWPSIPHNRLQRLAQASLRLAQRPLFIVGLHHLQRNQLLQRPPSRKPLARRELRHRL